MFREARFYEFYLFFYLLFIYLFILFILPYLNFSNFNSFLSYLVVKKVYIFLLLIVGLNLLFTSWSFAYILYSFIFLGFTLFLVKKQKSLGLLIFSLSIFLLILGLMIYTHGNIHFSDFLIQDSTSWIKNLTPQPFGSFSFFIVNHDIYFFVLFLFLGFFYFFLNLKIRFGSLLFFVLSLPPFLLLEFQGYGTYAPRYFYNYFVPLLMIISLAIIYALKLANKNLSKFFIFILLIVLISPIILNSYRESNSAIDLNSIVDLKNNNLEDMFGYVLTTYDNYSIYTDSFVAVPFYLYSNNLPKGILFEDKRIATLDNKTDYYLNVSYLSVKDIVKIKTPSLFLMWNSLNLDPVVISEFDKDTVLVYKQGAKRAYLINNSR